MKFIILLAEDNTAINCGFITEIEFDGEYTRIYMIDGRTFSVNGDHFEDMCDFVTNENSTRLYIKSKTH